jgi:hypothetical protein
LFRALFIGAALAAGLSAQTHRTHGHARTVEANTATTATTSMWKPTGKPAWQWQLSTPVNQTVVVPIYDIDGFDNSASVVASLHAKGRKVVCYMDVGTWEDWRPDASSFPSSVKGRGNGWPGEKWLDIRQIGILGPIMGHRFDLCKAKGFDAVEPDNIDGYSNHSGFPLSYQDQLDYNRYIAGLAHARGMSIALKNDVEQVPDLLASFDFALNEECFTYQECDSLAPFLRSGKSVLEVEYNLSTGSFCPTANAMGISAMKKREDLDAWRQPCF